MNNYTRILGTGAYLPEKVLTNAELETKVDTTDQWIVDRCGIKERRVVAEHETALTMAEQAAKQALAVAKLEPKEIDLIIVSTSVPDLCFPGVAFLLQERLGCKNCPAFDLNSSACAGFIYILSIADQYIKTGAIKHALLVGSEPMSRILDWTDRTTCVLFGDGAGAVVVGADDKPGIHLTKLHADGHYKELLYLPSKMGSPLTQESFAIKMHGRALFKVVVNTLGKLFDDTLQEAGFTKQAIDWLIPHQANARMIIAMAKKLELAIDQVAMTLEEYGNTSAASIPITLDKYINSGAIKRNDLLLLEGFGAGLAWGSALLTY